MIETGTVKKSPGNLISREIDPLKELPLFGTAAILAGGKSSRMGFDKQLLMENDRRILEQVIETLKQEFEDIIIVTARPELYADMDVRLFCDEYQGKGPLAGVHTAMHHAQSKYVYLLACDMPVVNLEFIRYMKRRLMDSKADVCVCERDGHLEPFNTFYSRDLLPEVAYRLETGNSSLFRFIHASDACIVSQQEAARFDKELQMFININTRSEFEKYLGAKDEGLEGDGLALIGKKDILRYIGGEFVQLRDLMVHEKTLHLEIAGIGSRTLYCSPSEMYELVVGHLYTQGYIHSINDIENLELDEEAGSALVHLETHIEESEIMPEGIVFDPEILLKNQQEFYDQSILQKATAGTHRCALCDDSGTYYACVDISRHNCLDKVVGKALMHGIQIWNKYILTSGRIPMDMIQKIVNIKAPMIVSRSTPTIAAVEVARKANITLLGFSRENRFNIYSSPHRLKGCVLEIPED